MAPGKGSRWRSVTAMAVMAAAVAGGAPLLARVSSKPAPAKLATTSGVATFRKWCSDCHSRPTGPGTMALQRKYNGDIPAVLEDRTDLTPEFVTLAVRQGISFMPSFRKTEISDAELAQVGAYLTSAKIRGRPEPKRP